MSNTRMTLTPEEVAVVKKMRRDAEELAEWGAKRKAEKAEQAACKHIETKHSHNCTGWMRDDSTCTVHCVACGKYIRTCTQGY